MGPKCHHMYPYEKEAKGLWGQAHRRAGNVKTGTEIGVMWIQVKARQQLAELGETAFPQGLWRSPAQPTP